MSQQANNDNNEDIIVDKEVETSHQTGIATGSMLMDLLNHDHPFLLKCIVSYLSDDTFAADISPLAFTSMDILQKLEVGVFAPVLEEMQNSGDAVFSDRLVQTMTQHHGPAVCQIHRYRLWAARRMPLTRLGVPDHPVCLGVSASPDRKRVAMAQMGVAQDDEPPTTVISVWELDSNTHQYIQKNRFEHPGKVVELFSLKDEVVSCSKNSIRVWTLGDMDAAPVLVRDHKLQDPGNEREREFVYYNGFVLYLTVRRNNPRKKQRQYWCWIDAFEIRSGDSYTDLSSEHCSRPSICVVGDRWLIFKYWCGYQGDATLQQLHAVGLDLQTWVPGHQVTTTSSQSSLCSLMHCPGHNSHTAIAFDVGLVKCLDLDNDFRVVYTYPFDHDIYQLDALDGSIFEYRPNAWMVYKAESGKEERLLQCPDNAKPRKGVIDQNAMHLFLGMDTLDGDGGLPVAVYWRSSSLV